MRYDMFINNDCKCYDCTYWSEPGTFLLSFTIRETYLNVDARGDKYGQKTELRVTE